MNDTISLEPAGSRDLERCECCGRSSRTVWGLARRGGDALGAYFVHWTPGQVADHGAHFDLILGPWGEGAAKADRSAVSLEFRRTANGPAFMVIDATTRPIAQSELVGRPFRRDEVVGTEVARLAFELVDAIWLHHGRTRELAGDGS